MYTLYIQYTLNVFVYGLNNVALRSRNHINAPLLLFLFDLRSWFACDSSLPDCILCIYVISTLDTLFCRVDLVVTTVRQQPHAALYTQHGIPRAAGALFM